MKIKVEFEVAVSPEAVGDAVKRATKEAQEGTGEAEVRHRVGDNVIAIVTVTP